MKSAENAAVISHPRMQPHRVPSYGVCHLSGEEGTAQNPSQWGGDGAAVPWRRLRASLGPWQPAAWWWHAGGHRVSVAFFTTRSARVSLPPLGSRPVHLVPGPAMRLLSFDGGLRSVPVPTSSLSPLLITFRVIPCMVAWIWVSVTSTLPASGSD